MALLSVRILCVVAGATFVVGCGGASDAEIFGVARSGVGAFPTAVDDVATASEDGPSVNVDVLANDSDPEGAVSLVSFDTTGTLGTVAFGGAGGLDYDPAGAFESLAIGSSTTDTFTYVIQDTALQTASATVTVTVNGVNDAPVAIDDLGYVMNEGGSLTIVAPGLLANDTDVDAGAILSAVPFIDAPNGIEIFADGSMTVTPPTGFSGVLSFAYTVVDGNGGSDSGDVSVTVVDVNSPPTVAITGVSPAPAFEGGLVSITVSVADPDPDARGYRLVLNPGDGPDDPAVLVPTPGTYVLTHTWADDDADDSYPVTVTVTDHVVLPGGAVDADAETGSIATAVVVRNAPPVASLSGNDPVPEGSLLALNLGWADAGTDSFPSIVLGFGDGSPAVTFSSTTAGTRAFNHLYADAGTYVASISLDDEDGGSSVFTRTIVVTDTAPQIVSMTSNGPVPEGSSALVRVQIAGVAGGDAVSYAFTPAVVTQTGGNAAFVRNDNGTTNVSVTVTDDEGSSDVAVLSVVWTNVAPTIVSAIPTGAAEGSSVSIAVTATDPSSADVLTTRFDWNADGDFVDAGESSSSHVYADDGSYAVKVQVSDDDGGTSDVTVVVAVSDLPPSAGTLGVSDPGADGPDEGEVVTLTLTGATDPSGDPLTFSFDVDGDGSVDSSGPNPQASHTYPNDGAFTVSWTVRDDRGGTATSSALVVVANVLPAVIVSTSVAPEGQATLVSLAATDPGSDPLTFDIAWGDGATDLDVGGTASHVYANRGAVSLAVTVSDDDGATVDTTPLVVPDVPVTFSLLSATSPAGEGSTIGVQALAAAAVTDTVSCSFPGAQSATSLTATYLRGDDATQAILVICTDGDGGANPSRNTTLLWTNVAPAPVVQLGCTTAANASGGAYLCDLGATDPAGANDTTAFTIVGGPEGMTIAGGTGVVSWTPSAVQSRASQAFLVRLTDEDGGESLFTQTVTTYGDTDADGVPDVWESAFGTDPLVADGVADPDTDGLTNAQEFGQGSDPGTFNGPARPLPLDPINAAEVASTSPMLRFRNATDPDGDTLVYQIEVFPNAALSGAPAATVFPLVSGSAQLPGGIVFTEWPSTALADDADFWWRVRAWDGGAFGDWSPVATFFANTTNDAPSAPVVSAPSDGFQSSSLSPSLEIGNSTDSDRDALTYRFEIASNIGFGTIVAASPQIAAGDSGTTGWTSDVELSDNTVYWWRSRATDEHGLAGTDSAVASFFVNTANNPPLTLALVAPEDGAEVTDATPDLTVENVPDLDQDTLSYEFQVADSPAFGGATSSGPVVEDPSGSTMWTTPALQENVRYYWRARASDGEIAGDWSVGSFVVNAVNDAPGVPVAAQPGDGALVEADTAVLVVRNAVDPDGDPIVYRFRVYTGSGLSTLFDESGDVAETAETTSFAPTRKFAAGATYFWTAEAVDDEDLASGPSPANRFRTLSTGGAGCGCNLAGENGAAPFGALLVSLLAIAALRARRSSGERGA